jgi:glycosyltransferase involved in cell wall biosynthesis
MHPRVSVIIPAYNCDRYITQAIDSVLSQDYWAYEVVVVDDGSTDTTPQKLADYGSRIRVIRQKNQGVSAARNRGIEEARGELVAFLDADDYFLPHKLAHQVLQFEAYPPVGIVHSGWQRIDQSGTPLIDVTPWKDVPELTLEHWLRWKPVLPSAMMFRRHWLEACGGFDHRFSQAEDTDLVLRLATMGCLAVWLPEVTVCYRQHPQNASHSGIAQVRAIATILDELYQRPDLPPSVQRLERQIRYNTLVWSAWYLYKTQQYSELVDVLKTAWAFRLYPPVATLTNWIESFAEFSRRSGESFNADRLGRSPQWQQLTQWVMAAMTEK